MLCSFTTNILLGFVAQAHTSPTLSLSPPCLVLFSPSPSPLLSPPELTANCTSGVQDSIDKFTGKLVNKSIDWVQPLQGYMDNLVDKLLDDWFERKLASSLHHASNSVVWAQDFISKMVDKLPDDLFERALNSCCLTYADLDASTLRKSSHFANSSGLSRHHSGSPTTMHAIADCYTYHEMLSAQTSRAAPSRLLSVRPFQGASRTLRGSSGSRPERPRARPVRASSGNRADPCTSAPQVAGASSALSTTAQTLAPAIFLTVEEAAVELKSTMSMDALRAALKAEGLRPKGRKKIALAESLYRARRAMEVLRADDAMLQRLPERYDKSRAGTMLGVRLTECRLCRGPLLARRRTFCCDECVHFHTLRTSGRAVRDALLVRDKGVCALCGVNAYAAYKDAKAAVWTAVEAWRAEPHKRSTREEAARTALKHHLELVAPMFAPHARLGRSWRMRPSQGSFWQADHVIAVADGGGSCGLSNIRTLCVPCHGTVTASQSQARAAARRDEEKVEIVRSSLEQQTVR